MKSSLENKTLFVVIDAFRWDYLTKENSPFLFRLKEKSIYVKKIKPSLGFCEISEFLTGTSPNKNKNFTQFNFSEESPYKKIKPLLNIANLIEKIVPNKKLIHRGLERILKFFGFRYLIYNIPFKVLNKIKPTEAERSYFEGGAFKVESIFDILDKREVDTENFVEYNYIQGDDEFRFRNLINKSKTKKFYIAYFGGLDGKGHKFGPGSREIKEEVKKVDRYLQTISKRFVGFNIIFLGDHGMLEVKEYLNMGKKIEGICKRHKINPDKIDVFLDSTIVRINSKDKGTESILKEEFKKMKGGKLLDKKDYGGIVWSINKGGMIYPDYFNFKKPRGMHGYREENYQKGLCIITGPRLKKKKISEGNLIDVCPTLCDLLNIRYPKQNEGKSLLRN